MKRHRIGKHGSIGWLTNQGLVCGECNKFISHGYFIHYKGWAISKDFPFIHRVKEEWFWK